MTIQKQSTRISSLTEWEHKAGPKSPAQWADGRSAKEVARAWLEGVSALPSEVSQALASHSAFGPIRSWTAEPETKLPFDDFAGEPCNADLAVHVEDAHGPYLIAVEAKADEPFGETVADALVSSLERLLDNKQSKGLLRIQQLAQALFGARHPGDPAIGKVRYQLLTACAGAICEAERRGYSRALVLIHKFITAKTDDRRHQANAADLDTFVARLSHGAIMASRSEGIWGPFPTPGSPLFKGTARLFIAEVSRNIR